MINRRDVNEEVVVFYDTRICDKADTIFRVAFGLSLSIEAAAAYVRKVFEEVSAHVEEYTTMDDTGLYKLLIKETWKTHQELKGNKYTTGKSAVTSVIQPLKPEARMALMAVDIVGMDVPSVSQALEWDTLDTRKHLAEARKLLLTKRD